MPDGDVDPYSAHSQYAHRLELYALAHGQRPPRFRKDGNFSMAASDWRLVTSRRGRRWWTDHDGKVVRNVKVMPAGLNQAQRKAWLTANGIYVPPPPPPLPRYRELWEMDRSLHTNVSPHVNGPWELGLLVFSVGFVTMGIPTFLYYLFAGRRIEEARKAREEEQKVREDERLSQNTVRSFEARAKAYEAKARMHEAGYRASEAEARHAMAEMAVQKVLQGGTDAAPAFPPVASRGLPTPGPSDQATSIAYDAVAEIGTDVEDPKVQRAWQAWHDDVLQKYPGGLGREAVEAAERLLEERQ